MKATKLKQKKSHSSKNNISSKKSGAANKGRLMSKQKKEDRKYDEDLTESEIEEQQAPLVIDLDDLKHQFNKLDPKTISLSKNTMEHINSTLTFLTCENATLQQ